MKLKFIFGKDNVDIFSTNILKTDRKEIEAKLNDPNNIVLSYTLNDLPLTKKLITLWPAYLKQQSADNDCTYHFNYYPTPTVDLLLTARIEMNETITQLNTHGYVIPDSLRLDLNKVSSLTTSDIEKLNQLHFLFEKNVIAIEKDNPNILQITHLWEKINNLVHFIEPTPVTPQKNSFFNFVARVLVQNPNEYYRLQDEDYMHFTQPDGGDLLADFSTIGKDLFACFTSNDMELVKKGEVKQQEYLTDWFTLAFNDWKNSPDVRPRYYKWCETNQVGKFINFKSPKYNSGRHVLGKIDQYIYTSADFYNKVFKNTPKFLGYILCDDKDNIVYE